MLFEVHNNFVGVVQLVLKFLVVTTALEGIPGPYIGCHAFVELVDP